jgi:hypothetical protein
MVKETGISIWIPVVLDQTTEMMIRDINRYVANLQEFRWPLNARDQQASLPGTDTHLCDIIIVNTEVCSLSELLPRFLSKYTNNKIYKTIIVPFVWMWKLISHYNGRI